MKIKIERPSSKQPIPTHAKEVFKGVLFSVFQWEQEMFDGSISIFEKVKRDDTVITLPITKEGKIILTLQEQPGKIESFVGLAGGRFVDSQEDPVDAAKRELREETGYDSTELELFKAYQPINKIEWAIYIFIARNCEKVGNPELDAGEKIELKFVDYDEFLKEALKDNFYEYELTDEIRKAIIDGKTDELRKRIMNPD